MQSFSWIVPLWIFALLFTSPAWGQRGHPFQVGQPFPSLWLPALEDGRPMTVASFAGRKLVLHIWASW